MVRRGNASTLRGPTLITELLVIIAPPLIPAPKRFGHLYSGILPLEVFDQCRHLPHHLIVFFAARARVQSVLESHAIELLIVPKLFTVRRIMFLFCAAQTNPPLFARRIDPLRTFRL